MAPIGKKSASRTVLDTTPRMRMRFVPARLPPPRRVVSLLSRGTSAQGAGNAKASGQGGPRRVEKADRSPAAARIPGPADRRKDFRFAAGPGAKRAPTVLYGIRGPAAAHAASQSIEPSIRSIDPLGFDGADGDARGQLQSRKSSVHVEPDGATASRPADRREGPRLIRLPTNPTFRISAENAASVVATHGVELASIENGSNAQGSDSCFMQVISAADREEPSFAGRGGSTLQLDVEMDPGGGTSVRHAALSEQGWSRLEADERSLLAPAPSGRGVTVPRPEDLEAFLDASGTTSRTTSSVSSGIWSRLPSQFDHRFPAPERTRSRSASKPAMGLSTLIAAAIMEDDGAQLAQDDPELVPASYFLSAADANFEVRRPPSRVIRAGCLTTGLLASRCPRLRYRPACSGFAIDSGRNAVSRGLVEQPKWRIVRATDMQSQSTPELPSTRSRSKLLCAAEPI